MGNETTDKERSPRGLLSNAEREFLKGQRDVEDPEGYLRNLRYRVRKQIDRIENDMSLLEDAGKSDITDEFYNRFSRYKQLERELDELQSELSEGAE